MPWKTFLKAHLGAIAAADFFTVEVLTLASLVRYSVLFIIEIKTRRVQIAGIVRQPHGTVGTAVASRRGRGPGAMRRLAPLFGRWLAVGTPGA